MAAPASPTSAAAATATATAAASTATAASPDPAAPRQTRIRARTRTSSLTQSILDANPHSGFCAATGDALSSAPSLKDLRRNSLNSVNSGSRSRGALQRRSSTTPATSPGIDNGGAGAHSPIHEEWETAAANIAADTSASIRTGHDDDREEEQPHWWAVTKSGLYAFWNWSRTPIGFFITIYMLNIVGWGGMLFLLLCNASPAMCTPSCNDINSPRRIWIEIDSQILNALFCVTGFGLIPWRFRDLWFLLRWRVSGRRDALVRLQEIHSAWFRGPLQDDDDDTVLRAPQTKGWKLDFVVWMYVWNTFLQIVLSGFMWGMNRIERPSWSTGLFVALACIVAGAAGGMVWWEGKQVKRIEGEREKEGSVRGKEAQNLV